MWPLLSDDTIPSIKGEWYNYRSVFTPERPLGYLMKCKANKDRAWYYLEKNPDVDLVFIFGEDGVRVCSPDSSMSVKLMSELNVGTGPLNKTLMTEVDITMEQFGAIRDNKDQDSMVSTCHCNNVTNQLLVRKDVVIAISTSTGKYCLMRATEVGPEAVQFDACHILL